MSMRIISQNGMIDVPYEMTAFHVAEGTIRMNMVGETGKGTIMAKYSTPEKAMRAMELLREVYTRGIIINYAELPDEDIGQLLKGLHNGRGIIPLIIAGGEAKIEPLNIAFRFPQEDEIND